MDAPRPGRTDVHSVSEPDTEYPQRAARGQAESPCGGLHEDSVTTETPAFPVLHNGPSSLFTVIHAPMPGSA